MAVPRGERLIILLIGKRNSGKSSLINALTGQEIAIVSETPGTTTDPVDKHYELLPLGPVTFYDTAGIDDTGELGQKRIRSTRKILFRTDIAVIVIGDTDFDKYEEEIISEIQQRKIPLLAVFNKIDIFSPSDKAKRYCLQRKIPFCQVSCTQKTGINECKEKLIELAPEILKKTRPLVGDLLRREARVILVTPIDSAAPKGRLILPQVQVLRDLLEHDAVVTVVKETELVASLQSFRELPDLVITDSQAIEQVAAETPEDVLLTTFSILFARYKGELDVLLEGTRFIDKLKDGDKILIAEACSHHVQPDDIGRNKLPTWIKQYTGKKLIHQVYAGHDFPGNLEEYALAIHCGACMINPMEMSHRIHECQRRGVPITNYGMAICKFQGVLERVVRIFRKELQ